MTTYQILCFILAIIVHEYGHYLGFQYLGYKKPLLKLKWWGIQIGENYTEAGIMKVRHIQLVALAGVTAGTPILILTFGIINGIILSAILSLIDLFSIIALTTMKPNETLYQNIKKDYEQMKQKHDLLTTKKTLKEERKK